MSKKKISSRFVYCNGYDRHDKPFEVNNTLRPSFILKKFDFVNGEDERFSLFTQ